LNAAGVAYAVCGGIAVTIHGATRTTKDIDVLIAPSDLSRALDAVRPLGYSYVELPMTFEADRPNERHVQRVSKLEAGHTMVIDFLHEDAAFAGLLADRVDLDLL
jgi:hypothetical protein